VSHVLWGALLTQRDPLLAISAVLAASQIVWDLLLVRVVELDSIKNSLTQSRVCSVPLERLPILRALRPVANVLLAKASFRAVHLNAPIVSLELSLTSPDLSVAFHVQLVASLLVLDYQYAMHANQVPFKMDLVHHDALIVHWADTPAFLVNRIVFLVPLVCSLTFLELRDALIALLEDFRTRQETALV
jgi:hypothetical protein